MFRWRKPYRPGDLCPTCRAYLMAHCSNKKCDWVRCEKCGGYGQLDRWLVGKNHE